MRKDCGHSADIMWNMGGPAVDARRRSALLGHHNMAAGRARKIGCLGTRLRSGQTGVTLKVGTGNEKWETGK